MKELQMWKHPDNENYNFPGFKNGIKRVLNKAVVGRQIMLKAVKMIDLVFKEEYFDVEIAELRNRFNKKVNESSIVN